MAIVNMKYMPTPTPEHVVNLDRLDGGLNLDELPFRLKNNESPAMKNLFWRDGVLCARDGQEWTIAGSGAARGGNLMYERLFHGFVVAVRYGNIYYADPNAEEPRWMFLAATEYGLFGAFFHYFDDLYYKGEGCYVRISYGHDSDDHPILTAEHVEGYTPVTVINASPLNGGGDLYQPENRIQAKKTVWYNAEAGVLDYHLPVGGLDNDADHPAFIRVEVDGIEKTEGTDFTVNYSTGVVSFVSGHEPQVTVPPTNNTVKITYKKTNEAAYKSIMDCVYAAAYGGTGDLCIVLGGSTAQPNAIFWNGNDNLEMNPAYFPFYQYQLIGDTNDPVTGFGEQQSFLVVFQEHSVGRIKQSFTELDGRTVIDMPYVAINDKIGCDCPGTIQLIENNLVWCNSEQGVHFLKDTSYAYENNIVCISRKINGSHVSEGLLPSTKGKWLTSHDDTRRYWVICPEDGKAWVWDYEHTSYKDPSWYPFTNIYACGLSSEVDDTWGLHRNGGLFHFTRSYRDFGSSIEMSYRFATQALGGYDRLKNVNSVIICMRPDTNSIAELTYITDYEVRKDKTLLMRLVWSLVPRDLSFRSLLPVNSIGAWVFRRRPMCRRVKHFTMQLDNTQINENLKPGKDLSIVSAQIFFNYQGRFR